jgi:hypothetical protein
MGRRRGVADSRVHKRFPAKDRALVSIGTESNGLLYHLIEISTGGLSFRYPGEDILTKGRSELSIILEDNFYVGSLPVEIVSDTLLVKGYIPIRRRSVRFGELSPTQKTQLIDFIKKNTEQK